MSTNKFDLKRYLIPSDAIYIVVIAIGMFIMIFLAELPVRLIGACIALLSAVVLVMNITQRLKDRVEFRRPAVSQPVDLPMQMRKDKTGTRLVFSDFDENFGGDDIPMEEESASVTQRKEASSVREETTVPRTAKRLRIDDADGTVEQVESPSDYGVSRVASAEQKERTTPARRENPYMKEYGSQNREDDTKADFSDDLSGVRIVGKRTVTENDTASKRDNNKQPKQKSETPDDGVDNVRKVMKIEDDHQQRRENERTESKKRNSEPPPPVFDREEHNDNDLAPETAVLPQHHAEEEHAGAETMVIESQPAVSHRHKQLNVALHDLIDDIEHPGNEEPRKEFDHLLSRVLMVIRSMMSARTAAFYWVNFEKSELVLESHITDATECFNVSRKLPLGMDIISQLASSGRPEILTEISAAAELDLIPYYTAAAGTRSFVGVPVYLNHSVIGVLCADSEQDDAYDEITIGSLGHFTKLISGLTQSYTGKYDLLQSSRILDALSHFRALVQKGDVTATDVSNAMVEAVCNIIEHETVGVVLYDEQRELWVISTIGSQTDENQLLKGEMIDTTNSLVAQTLFGGETTRVAPTHSTMRRYHPHEMMLDNGYFVAVPLRSASHNYGALFVEGLTSQLTDKDIEILEALGEQSGTIIEQLHVQQMLSANALTDASSGLLNGAAFINRIEEEIARARDFNTQFVLVLIVIDRYNAIEEQLGESGREDIFNHVLLHVQNHTRPYDVLGRLDDNLIGWGTSGRSDTEMQAIAERVRKEVAISVKEINNKRFTVTTSIGIARAVHGETAEILATNANRAMELAMTKTNSVAVFA
ncbi:MAG: diguanylate cyclase [Candidatus Kapabacteria bacterium]|nr:diguanylate cyclase [Candidatus Kapabacteria bacterium]